MKEQPNYFAMIPANVRYSKITPNAKLLFGELTALTNKEGYCWASNQYFADLYGVSKNTVSGWVSELVKHNFVQITVQNMNERKIYLLLDHTGKSVGGTRKSRRGDTENHVHNSTSISNTTIGETEVSQMKTYEIVPDIDEDSKERKATTKEVMTVLRLFEEHLQVDTTGWAINKTQRQAITNLLSRGKWTTDLIASALRYVSNNRDEKYLKWIFSPHDLDTNWNHLKFFKERQES